MLLPLVQQHCTVLPLLLTGWLQQGPAATCILSCMRGCTHGSIFCTMSASGALMADRSNYSTALAVCMSAFGSLRQDAASSLLTVLSQQALCSQPCPSTVTRAPHCFYTLSNHQGSTAAGFAWASFGSLYAELLMPQA